MFTKTDLTILNAARQILHERSKVPYDAGQSRDLGRFQQACETAEHQIFKAINVDASYLESAEAKEAVHGVTY